MWQPSLDKVIILNITNQFPFLFIHSVVQSINVWFVQLAFSNITCRCLIAPCKGIGILESEKLFFACGVWDPGPWNLEYSSRNLDPTNNWNTYSKFHAHRIRNQELGIWNPQHGIQNPKMSWIPKHWACLRQNLAIAIVVSSFMMTATLNLLCLLCFC